MAFKVNQFDPQSAAEKAVSVLGYGYDLTADIQLSACKMGPSGSRLIEFDQTTTKDLVVPGGIVISNVTSSIKCDKGERTRFRSDVISFQQMSEQFNQELSLSGKIPSGLFNAMFGFQGSWLKDAGTTKTLAFDGLFISLYNVELVRSQFSLSETLKQQVPPGSWDPAAIAEFIEKYGTHIVVGVKMGGKDVIHIKQLQESNLNPDEVQELLKQLADEQYAEDVNGSLESNTDKFPSSSSGSHSNNDMQSMQRIHIRRGGIDNGQSHNQWLSTVPQSPDVISMSFVPIASLLNGVSGSGFISHAINLYLRYKPPIEELRQFLEFQLPRQWAPVFGALLVGSRRKKQSSPALQFTFMGPKLYVNTEKVDSGNKPVTGVRLYLEGTKGDQLAIHLQHLSTLPKILQLSVDHTHEPIDEPLERLYFEPVNWSIFSHICTAPVEYNGARGDESASIVTKAWFEVRAIGMKKVLFLRLGFSTVGSANICRSEWEGPTSSTPKLGLISQLISKESKPSKRQASVDINSALYPGGPPLAKVPKMSQFVDTEEMLRGPGDPPGYWVVNGVKLCLDGGRIRINVKYSLLTIMSEDSVGLRRN